MFLVLVPLVSLHGDFSRKPFWHFNMPGGVSDSIFPLLRDQTCLGFDKCLLTQLRELIQGIPISGFSTLVFFILLIDLLFCLFKILFPLFD